jgi:hypothetical protein
MNWIPMSALSTFQRRADGRGLLMYVTRGVHGSEWLIAAIESNAVPAAVEMPTEDAIASVFASHAHQTLPVERTLPRAIAAAEKYAKWWARSGARHGACDCDEITGGGNPIRTTP